MTDRRTPPKDMEAEKVLLGMAIIDNKRIPDMIGMVEPNDFYGDKNRTIWEAIVTLSCDGKEVSLSSLYEYLNGTVQAGDIGELLDGLSASSDIRHYAKIVRDRSKQRRMLQAAMRLTESAYSGDMDEAATIIAGLANQKIIGRRDRVLSDDVQKWVETTTGQFTVTDCYNSIPGVTQRDRSNIRTILSRLKDKGVIEPVGKTDGHYRRIDNSLEEMDWRNAPENPLPIILPLNLNSLVRLYGKSLVVIAGQSNQGKSAILLNTIKDNMGEFDIHYYTSEFGPSMVKKRFSLFEDVNIDDWRVHVYGRAHDFHDVIKDGPRVINIVDWLWSGTTFYEAGGDLEKIFRKLKEGIAIVALQKDPGKEYGRGGPITMDLASLYLSVFPGEVKIVKAKNWDGDNGNPNGKVLKIKIVNASRLIPGSEGWQHPESLEAADQAVGKSKSMFRRSY